MAQQRLDKIIASTGRYSRREVKTLVREGRVLVDGCIAASAEDKCDPLTARISVNGEELFYREHTYVMLHKPAGVLSATEDGRGETVLDLLAPEYRKIGLFPVGRLDKDTTGLLLVTDDGDYVHRVITPKKHVPKVYFARTDGQPTSADVDRFAQGVVLGDGTQCLPARLELLRQSPPVLLDGAHNPNGGRALCDAVKSLGLHDLTAVVGMLRDKDCLPVLQMMAPYCTRMIVTTVPNPRSYPAEEFAGLARSVCPRVTVCPDCQEAARLALAEGGNGVLVFGSLYLASAVRPVMLAETEKK